MLEMLGIAALIWIVWKMFRAASRTATTQAYHQGAAESLDLPSAEAQHREAEDAFIGAAGGPIGTEHSDIQGMLDKAVFLKDRVRQLTGKQHGPAFRAQYRNKLVRRANRVRTALSEAASSPTYESFEEWLEEFKSGAGDANDILAKKESGCLIDFMDLAPLRRAYADDVEPYQLGKGFGEHFDFGEFMSNNSQKAT